MTNSIKTTYCGVGKRCLVSTAGVREATISFPVSIEIFILQLAYAFFFLKKQQT